MRMMTCKMSMWGWPVRSWEWLRIVAWLQTANSGRPVLKKLCKVLADLYACKVTDFIIGIIFIRNCIRSYAR